ncbi:MAG: hypothetical protein [Caudoviricetes sp.]|nr:MAG: hypothetical protein [Caudoviricetes sp.]
MMDQDYRSQVWDDSVIQWLAVEIVSGQVIGELPDLQASTLSVRMEDITSTEAQLPYDKAPDNWLELTTPYKIALILVRDHIPQWGGIIIKRTRVIRGKSIQLTLTSIEHYLDSVYITDKTYKQASQTAIAAGLAHMTDDHRFGLLVEMADSPTLRDRTYTADQDKTVLSALQELSNVIGGPEFYTSWRLADDGMTYHPVISIADHIGSSEQVTTFDASIMADFQVLEDYSTGYGANRVKATSTADGTARPESYWYYDTSDNGRPFVEYKYSPSSSIINVGVLNDHARSKLLELRYGTTTISFTAALLEAPRLGVDWSVGDIVGYDVSDDIGQYPDYQNGKMRVIGYDLDFQNAWILSLVLRPVEGATR